MDVQSKADDPETYDTNLERFPDWLTKSFDTRSEVLRKKSLDEFTDSIFKNFSYLSSYYSPDKSFDESFSSSKNNVHHFDEDNENELLISGNRDHTDGYILKTQSTAPVIPIMAWMESLLLKRKIEALRNQNNKQQALLIDMSEQNKKLLQEQEMLKSFISKLNLVKTILCIQPLFTGLHGTKGAILMDNENQRRLETFKDADLEAFLNKDSFQTEYEFKESLGMTQQAISLHLKAMRMIQMKKKAYHITGGSNVLLYSEGRIKTFTTGPPHTYTIVITAQIETRFCTEDGLIPFGCSQILLSTTPLQMEGTPRDGMDSDTETRSESAACVWTADNEIVGAMRYGWHEILVI
ncbi:hypothetical protein TNCV_489791 [Trichonephila clavipes]|nr:hypothetical protein TNCV_489791 [Trichonephila clavipes]